MGVTDVGLFQHKQTEDEVDGPLRFFDDHFREELRSRGREHFEKVIDDNATLFKKDLDATIGHVDTELKTHITNQFDVVMNQITVKIADQIDAEFVEYGKAMKDAEETALQSLTTRAKALEGQYQQLSAKLEQTINDQEAALSKIFEDNMTRVAAMHQAQEKAVQTLQRGVESMEQQYQQLNTVLQKNVVEQEAIMINVFEQNMARVVEHYLLGALGDQYDLKAQLPSIIKQMEEQKQAMVDDMKL